MQSSEKLLFSTPDRVRYGDLFQEAATLTMTVQNGMAVPLLHIQHKSRELLQGLRDSLGTGSVFTTRDFAYYEIVGVPSCRHFLRIIGDDPPFEGEMLRKFLVWKDLIIYLADTREPSLSEAKRMLMRIGR